MNKQAGGRERWRRRLPTSVKPSAPVAVLGGSRVMTSSTMMARALAVADLSTEGAARYWMRASGDSQLVRMAARIWLPMSGSSEHTALRRSASIAASRAAGSKA